MVWPSSVDLPIHTGACCWLTIYSLFQKWLTINSKCSNCLQILPVDSLKNTDHSGIHRSSKILASDPSFWVLKLETLIWLACRSNDLRLTLFLLHFALFVILMCWATARMDLLKIVSLWKVIIPPCMSHHYVALEKTIRNNLTCAENPCMQTLKIASEDNSWKSPDPGLHVIPLQSFRKTHKECSDMRTKYQHANPKSSLWRQNTESHHLMLHVISLRRSQKTQKESPDMHWKNFTYKP